MTVCLDFILLGFRWHVKICWTVWNYYQNGRRKEEKGRIVNRVRERDKVTLSSFYLYTGPIIGRSQRYAGVVGSWQAHTDDKLKKNNVFNRLIRRRHRDSLFPALHFTGISIVTIHLFVQSTVESPSPIWTPRPAISTPTSTSSNRCFHSWKKKNFTLFSLSRSVWEEERNLQPDWFSFKTIEHWRKSGWTPVYTPKRLSLRRD